MATFITDDELKTALLGTLQRKGFDAAGVTWDDLIPKANRDAYNDILAALIKRGYTKEQIDQWDFGATYNQDIALYHLLVKGGAGKDWDETFILLLDRRKMLEDVPVLIDGEDPLPDEPEFDGGVSSGIMQRDDDRFKR